jgi:imidazolonepropionase
VNPDLLLLNASQVVTVDPDRATPQNPLGVLSGGAVAVEAGKIVWVGPSSHINPADYPGAQGVDLSGRIVTPGFVDSHTHPVFAGDRSDEFEERLQGVSYLEIARRGGGIQKTVNATRQASEEELYILTRQRLLTMLSFGVTTVEVKSGYGLDWASEEKSLRVLCRLRQELPMTLCVTYMGAHDIPREHKADPEAYIDQLCTDQLPRVARQNLAEFCDVFCEEGYFSVAQSRWILETARDLGLKLKLHAEEFTDLGGAALAGELRAVSADHLLHVSDAGIAAMKAGGVTAVLLPGTAFYLRLNYAPARKLLDAGIPVALATDFNPGSCMSENLQLVMTLACLNMGMTPAEVLQGVTFNGARAVDLHHDRGTIAVGKRADLNIFRACSYNELLYHFGINHLERTLIAGQPVSLHDFKVL